MLMQGNCIAATIIDITLDPEDTFAFFSEKAFAHEFIDSSA
ncbi:hypothetical protein QM828_10690 [Rhodococcus erythropolis]|nr:hypothetical protein [Rhodococcus erythropolis]MDJ0012667.1 hypothetical protein [Rhodococcus erythropolis]